MSQKHLGSCLCGQVRFEILGDFESFFLCHCKYCQKDTGSAHAANLFSTNAKLEWLTGEEKVRTYNLPNTRHSKSFCINCGSAAPAIELEGKLVKVPAGSLDTDISNRPNAHIFVASKACWEKELDTINKFENFPS